MIEAYDDSPARGRIKLHDEHAADTNEDSLARLVMRQADAMKELREQRDELLRAAKLALKIVPGDQVFDEERKALRSAIKRTEVKKNGSHA